MGFLDDITEAVNRGAAAAQRTSRTAQIKFQINELMRQRRDLSAQLGASLYDAAKDMPELREGREQLFEGIAEIDAKKVELEQEIERIEAEAQEKEASTATYQCKNCGTTVSAADHFCAGCGASVASIIAAYETESQPKTMLLCANCGNPVGDKDLYCMQCGAKIVRPEGAAGCKSEVESVPEPPLGYDANNAAKA